MDSGNWVPLEHPSKSDLTSLGTATFDSLSEFERFPSAVLQFGPVCLRVGNGVEPGARGELRESVQKCLKR